MSSGSRRRAHAKYATKGECMTLLRARPGLDRFTFKKLMNTRMDVKYRNADDLVQLAIYEVIWTMSQRLSRRSPF